MFAYLFARTVRRFATMKRGADDDGFMITVVSTVT